MCPSAVNGCNVIVMDLPQKSSGSVSPVSLVHSLVITFPKLR